MDLPSNPDALALPVVDSYFSPSGGCTATWVREILSTRASFLVAGYAFTSPEIAAALISIHAAGKEVTGIFCPTMAWARQSQVGVIAAAGVPTFIDPHHRIFHNKFGVKDGAIVLEGSFNLTVSAEHYNAENLVVVRIKELADRYAANFAMHLAHAIPYTEKPVKSLHPLALGSPGDEDGAMAEGD